MDIKHNRTRGCLTAAALLPLAAGVAAQSLGGVGGAVIIGRPLDIVVQSSLSADDAAALCAQATVRYGDTALPASEVTLTVVRDDPRGSGLRVRARAPVNEPFVGVDVRVGCQGALARSYTLLADLEPLRPAAAPAVAAPAVPSGAPAPTPAVRAASAVRPGADSAAAPTEPETPVRLPPPAARPPGITRLASKTPPVSAAAPRPQAAGGVRAAAEPPAAPSGPRLKLDPVEVAPQPAVGPATPGASAEGGVPATSGAAAPPAAEPTAVPPAVQQELERLRQEQQRLLAAVEGLNRELAAAREERWPVWLWPAVAGAVGLLLGALGWAWRRGTTLAAVPWWAAPATPAAASPPAAAAPTPSVVNSPAPAPVPAEPVADESVVLGGDGGSVFGDTDATSLPSVADGTVQRVAAGPIGGGHATPEAAPPAAALDFAALHELWERVTFFEDLGQAADAVAALRSFVLAHPGASEAPYLRWWHVAKLNGLDARLAQVTYEQHYHRLLAPDDGRATLLDDGALLQALQAHWPGAEARHLIETALASQPGDAGSPLQVRTVAAFDDLITLHGMLDLLPLLPLTEGTAPAADDDHVIDFDFSGWQPPGAPAAPDGKSAS
ncbi:MAG: hypothetical protein ACK4Q6_07045 [Tepidimonas ignava]|uniref:hypothetical protein n=1 Tax=Tepidimonas ignava TaxID=114249 RepID=UPI00391C089C